MPWLTSDIFKAVRLKHTALKKARRFNCSHTLLRTKAIRASVHKVHQQYAHEITATQKKEHEPKVYWLYISKLRTLFQRPHSRKTRAKKKTRTKTCTKTCIKACTKMCTENVHENRICTAKNMTFHSDGQCTQQTPRTR